MKISDSKISKSSALIYRPFTTHTNSPRKIRQNNFLLDCTNRQSSNLPIYKPQNDTFIKPYVLNLLQKVKSKNVQNTPTLKIRQNFKIRQSTHALMQAEKFKSFLANQMQVVMQKMEQLKNTGFSSMRNSPQKENKSMDKNKKSQKEKFLDNKFNSYKITSKKGLSMRKSKNSNYVYQN